MFRKQPPKQCVECCRPALLGLRLAQDRSNRDLLLQLVSDEMMRVTTLVIVNDVHRRSAF